MIKTPPAPTEKVVVLKKQQPRIVLPVAAKRFSPPTKPLAIVQTGALGDIINVLPVARAIQSETGRKPPLVVSARYSAVFDRISYVEPVIWNGHDSDAKGISAVLGAEYRSVACMLWLRLAEKHATDNFLKEHWALLGHEKAWGKLPVVFDRRDSAEEDKVLEVFAKEIQGPFILMALGGNTSPVPDEDWVRETVGKVAHGVPVVDITNFRCKNPIDLIGLMEQATLFISSDSAPIHINRATKTPAILLGRPVESRWYLSETIENIKATFTYDTLRENERELCNEITRLLGGSDTALSSVVTGFNAAFEKVGAACVTAMDRTMPPLVKKSFDLFQETDLNPAWNKIGSLLRRLNYAAPGSWVVWVDADCIVNRWPPFDELLGKTGADSVFVKDWNGICTGVWAIKNCPWSVSFLKAILLCGDVADHTDSRFSPDGPKWEQNAVKALLSDFPALQKHVDYFPQDWVFDKPEQDAKKRFAIHHFGTGTPEQKINRIRCVSPAVCDSPVPPELEPPPEPTAQGHAAPQRYTTNGERYGREIGLVKYENDREVFSDPDALNRIDSSRFDFLCLAADMIAADRVPGDFVELGVYKGHTAAILGRFAQRLGRIIYLLDTFSGWDQRDIVGLDAGVAPEFADTSLTMVRSRLAAAGVYSAEYIAGRFPDTADQIPDKAVFSFVHLDCDLELPTLAALQFFYPRVAPGGFIVIHDYLSLYWPGLQLAVDHFRRGIPESIMPVPDASGTVVIRKARV